MESLESSEQAIDLLQELGLKEYESRTFVTLTRVPNATAKEISEHSSVPRTRVYDAVNVLESKGLVETQRSTPQRFRAVGTEEAVKTLQKEYQSRTASLEDALKELSPVERGIDGDDPHEIWALSGSRAIENRTEQLISEAKDEVFLIAGHKDVLTAELENTLRDATDTGIRVLIGTISSDLKEEIRAAVPKADTFISGVDWLQQAPEPDDDIIISRILLVDQNTILVSTIKGSADTESLAEHAIFGKGFENGIVALIRRLMTSGLNNTGTDLPKQSTE